MARNGSWKWRGQGRGRRRRAQWWRRLPSLSIILPLALACGLAVLDGGRTGAALPFADRAPVAADAELAQFRRCGSDARDNCVIDGDTFRYGGEKIRIADINTPETSQPACAAEAALGEAATARLIVLLNQGAFTLEPQRFRSDRDRYGRLLRTVTRGGDSLGDTLVDEGLAERWKGYRGSWC